MRSRNDVATDTHRGLAERIERGRESVRLRDVEGLTWTQVVARLGCSERNARPVYADHRRAAPVALEHLDVYALVARVIHSRERALDSVEDLLGRADNDHARVGPARSCASVGAPARVLARMGCLPDDQARWAVLREMRDFAQELLAARARHGVSRRGAGGDLLRREAFRRRGPPV